MQAKTARCTEVVDLVEHHRTKHFHKGLRIAFKAWCEIRENEKRLLKALLEFGWNADNMNQAEKDITRCMRDRAYELEATCSKLMGGLKMSADAGNCSDWETFLAHMDYRSTGSPTEPGAPSE